MSFALVTQRALDARVRGGLGVVAGTVFGLLTHALLAGRRSRSHPTFRTAMSRISGTVMIGLGVRAGLAAR